jgi:peptidoglycan/LPS O-acetylase OafA/YrhL
LQKTDDIDSYPFFIFFIDLFGNYFYNGFVVICLKTTLNSRSVSRQNYTFSIKVIRIISMLMIILCHILSEFQNNFCNQLSQFFNVGVFIFIFISGFLFGEKEIGNIKNWYKKRLIRIFVPYYCFMIFLFIVSKAVFGINITAKQCLLFLLNLQAGFCAPVMGADHLWFLSIIFVCYLLTPLLFRFRNCIKKSAEILAILLAMAQVAASIFVSSLAGRYIFLICLYCFAYLYCEQWKKRWKRRSVVILCTLAAGSMVLRVILRLFIHGTNFYAGVLVTYSHGLISLAVFSVVWYVLFYYKKTESRTVSFLSHISYDVYIIHYMFIVGPFVLIGKTYSLVTDIFLFVILTLFSAVLLNLISFYVVNLNKKISIKHYFINLFS